MPLHIIQQNITKIKCDAIVNAANNSLLGGGGVDGAIHSAAGFELLEECKTLGGCKTGDAKITKGYRLPCKYVIHTVGPIWQGGARNEKALLEACYQRSLTLAKEYGCESVAFPLISSGVYGYPKAQALAVAVDSISKFLFHNEMTVYIVIFDKSSYQINEKLYDAVASYVSDNLDDFNCEVAEECCELIEERYDFVEECSESRIDPRLYKELNLNRIYEKKLLSPTADSESLADMLSHLDDGFTVTLLKLIDTKGITDVECYKKANVSKQTWYKIINERDYRPSKNTVLSFAIALKLSLEETERLLSTVGFTLSRSSVFDVIIEYFLINGEYNIFTINETLFKFDQPCLGV